MKKVIIDGKELSNDEMSMLSRMVILGYDSILLNNQPNEQPYRNLVNKYRI